MHYENQLIIPKIISDVRILFVTCALVIYKSQIKSTSIDSISHVILCGLQEV